MKTLVDKLVNRFLSWSLPKDFAPDGYIVFDKTAAGGAKSHWPTGTNLLHASQAAEMFEHCLQLWQPIETAPKSQETECGVEGVYLLGFCPEPDLSNLESCICVIWWEPNMKGGKGMWYGEGGFETHPTLWMPLPQPPAMQEQCRPSVLFRPTLSLDGDQWCALYGADLQSGVAGFGNSPEDAMQDFDRQWLAKI